MSSFSRPGVVVNQSLTPLTSSVSGTTGAATACFVAAYNIGPTKPTLITSWQNYVNLYGGFSVAGGSGLAYAVWQFFANGGSGCYVLRCPNTDAVLSDVVIGSIAQTSGDSPAPVNASLLTFTANSPGKWGNGLFIEIVPQSSSMSDNTVSFNLNVYQGGTGPTNLVETWPSVSLNPASSRNLASLVNASLGGSRYVTATVALGGSGYSAGTGDSDPIGNAGSPTALSGGADGTTAPALDQMIQFGFSSSGGNPWSVTGLGSLSNQVLNVNLPVSSSQTALTQTVLNSVISWAQAQGSVMVVVDAPFGGVPLKSSTALAGTSSTPGTYGTYLTGTGTALDSQPNVALYGPWLSIQDPASSSANATTWVAPGGAVLGLWSKNDTQFNVARSPAGTSVAVSAVALEAYFTPSDLDNLETLQINPIKLIQGSGFCLFGARTLAIGYPNRYINVARTLMQFTVDFINITQFAIFQNNDPSLWQTITTVLTSYLTVAMQNGMLAGVTPATAFTVLCDNTTTTSAQAQAGIVNAQVAVALVSPAEFIIINLSQMQGGGSASVAA